MLHYSTYGWQFLYNIKIIKETTLVVRQSIKPGDKRNGYASFYHT
jgi:hypothetical protein